MPFQEKQMALLRLAAIINDDDHRRSTTTRSLV
jgi:hypothetical protein